MASLLTVFMIPPLAAGEPDVPPVPAVDPLEASGLRIRYEIDPAAVLAQFVNASTVTVRLPQLGVVQSEAQGMQIYASDANGSLVNSTSVPIYGRIAGRSDSRAVLLLTDDGILGTIDTTDYRFDLTPALDVARLVQVNTAELRAPELPDSVSVDVPTPWGPTRVEVTDIFPDEGWIDNVTGLVNTSPETPPLPASSASRFEPTPVPVFTSGDTGSVFLAERPMWIHLVELVEGDRVAIDFEDGNHAGQVVLVNVDWLGALGLTGPTFRFADGEVIPYEVNDSWYVVNVPHFSTVFIESAECPDDCTIGAAPTGWTIESTGRAFKIDRLGADGSAQSIKVQGGTGSGVAQQAWGSKPFADPKSPRTMSFSARMEPRSGNQPTWHTLEWRQGTSVAMSLSFRFNDAGTCWKLWHEGRLLPDCYTSNQWHKLKLVNINWVSCKYSIEYGGTVKKVNAAFKTCVDHVDNVRVGSSASGTPAWWVDNIQYELVRSLVVLHAEKRYVDETRNARPDWDDRMINGFAQHALLFDELGIEMVMSLAAPLTGNILVGNKCAGDGSVSHQYSNWLKPRLQASPPTVVVADAYQLWTSMKFDGCNGEAFRSDSVAGSGIHERWHAATVIEAVDGSNFDGYDGNSNHDRGIASGHEFGHVYGQKGHVDQYGTSCFQRCNIMADGWQVEHEFYFKQVTKDEVSCRFHWSRDAPC